MQGREDRPAKLGRAELRARVAWALGTRQYRILPHARQRCSERGVTATSIAAVLEGGQDVPWRDRYDVPHRNWSYCFEGAGIDGEDLRVVVAFRDWMLVVTVVRLGGDRED